MTHPAKAYLILLFMLLILFSCSKGGQEGECQKCGVMPVDKVLSIYIGTIEKTANLWKNDGRNNNNDYCIVDAQTTSSNAELAAALDIFNLKSSIKINTAALVGIAYFVNKNLSGQSSYKIELADLKAVIVYYESGAYLGVKVLEQDNGGFKEIEELASETDQISSNNSESLSEVYFNKGIPAISSILIADNSKLTDRKQGIDKFSYRLNKYLKKGTVPKPTGSIIGHYEHNGGDRCGASCLKGGSLTCSQRPTQSCKGLTDCPKAALQPWNTYTDGEDPRDAVLNQFRDNLMSQSATGQHFIEDFYYIGTVIKGNLNATVAAKSFAIIDTKVIPIANKLLESPTSTDILYDDTTRNQLIAYVNEIKLLSDDPMFLEIIEEVKTNIGNASGKTIKAVHEDILQH